MIIQMDAGEMASFWEQLSSYQRQNLFTDVCFVVDQDRFMAHRCVVAARSPVLAAMLQVPMCEASEHIVTVESGSAENFLVFLDYMYGRKSMLGEDSIFGLLELAVAYQVDGLVARCSSVLSDALDETSCWSILMAADQYSLDTLREKALAFAGEGFATLVLQPQFKEIEGRLLETLISSDGIANCEEEQVLEACLTWAEAHQGEEDRVIDMDTILPMLLSHVRWPSVPMSLEHGSYFYTILQNRLSSLLSPTVLHITLEACCLLSSAKLCRKRRRTCHLKRSMVIEGHSGAVSSLAFAGDRLLSGSWDQTCRVWQVDVNSDSNEGGKARCLNVMRGHKGAVLAIAVLEEEEAAAASKEGGEVIERFILTGAADGMVRRWDSHTYTEKARFFRSSGAVLSLALCHSARRIVCGYRDGDVYVTSYDFQNVEKLEGHEGGVYAIETYMDNIVVTGANDSCIKFWRLCGDDRSSSSNTADEDPNERYGLAGAGDDGRQEESNGNGTSSSTCILTTVAHTKPVYALVVVGRKVISSSYDQTIKIWEPVWGGANGGMMVRLALIATHTLHKDAVSSLQPCGEDLVCAGGWDGKVFTLSTSPEGPSPSLVDERPGRILAMALGNERILAIGSNDHSISVYS